MTDQAIVGSGAGRVNAPALLLLVLSAATLLPIVMPRLSYMLAEWPDPEIGLHLSNPDFINYWMAGKLALEGRTALLFDPSAYYAGLKQMFGPDYPPHAWSYPPHAILLFLPLGLLPYKAAMVVFTVATLLFHGVAAELFRRARAPLADPALFWAGQTVFVAVNVTAVQNGFLTSGLILLALAQPVGRAWLTGLCFGLLTIKPQLGLLVPFLLLFTRQWAAIAWSAAFATALVALSAVVFEVGVWRDYVAVVVPFQQGVLTTWNGIMLLMMPTVSASMRQVGVDPDTAVAVQTAFVLACLPLAIRALWKTRENAFALAAAFVVATFLVAPYSFNYDMGPLAVVCAALAAMPGAIGRFDGRFAAFLCLLPATVSLFAVAGAPVAPLFILAAFLSWFEPHRAGPAPIAARA